jgi:NADPH:quinone reductase-like Zn-dependent oxidoreductase
VVWPKAVSASLRLRLLRSQTEKLPRRHFMPGMKSGDIMGHEAMGEVVEVGRDNTALKVGDRRDSRR